MRMTGSDQNHFPSPDRKRAYPELHPSPAGQANDDHRLGCTPLSISTMRDRLGKKTGIRDVEVF